MPTIRESDLPGVGRKFQIDTRSGDRLVVVVHDSGIRELFHFQATDPDEAVSVVALDDDEARQVAGIIGGMTYKPKALESVELALDELVIDWLKLEPASPCAGRTIGELRIRQRTGATVIAVIDKEHQKRVNPGPDQTLYAEATLVVTGERQQVKALRHLLQSGDS